MNQDLNIEASERLRILHILPSLGLGGAEQMATHLMIGLSRSHTVGAVGLGPASNSVPERRLTEANIPRWHLDKRQGFDFRMFASLDRVIRDFRPQVVHTHMSVQRYVFPVQSRMRGATVIHTMHNLAEYETDAFGRLVHWVAFRNGVLPIGISREVSASVKRVYGLECRAVIPNCVPVEAYQRGGEDRLKWREREGFGPDAIVFTCVGRLEPQKNPHLLLQAMSKVQDPRAHLVFLGEGGLGKQLASEAGSLNLGGRVHFLGKRNDVPSVLAGSDVFVLGSSWEGNPLSVMEAMASGLPVVSTAVGGVPELVRSGEDGILVRAGDCAAFADAMKVLLDDSQKRLSMADAARTRALREFRLERMVQGYEDLYKETVTPLRNTQTKAARTWTATQA